MSQEAGLCRDADTQAPATFGSRHTLPLGLKYPPTHIPLANSHPPRPLWVTIIPLGELHGPLLPSLHIHTRACDYELWSLVPAISFQHGSPPPSCVLLTLPALSHGWALHSTHCPHPRGSAGCARWCPYFRGETQSCVTCRGPQTLIPESGATSHNLKKGGFLKPTLYSQKDSPRV